MNSQKITIRKIKEDDLLTIYKLSNDFSIRDSSFDTEIIPLETHQKWFTQKLNDKNCVFFIAELNNDLVGQVRYQIDNQEATVSICISNNYRHSGNGQIILRKTLKKLKSERPEIRNIIACIKPKNFISIKFFQKIGFIFQTNTVVKNHKTLIYSYQI